MFDDDSGIWEECNSSEYCIIHEPQGSCMGDPRMNRAVVHLSIVLARSCIVGALSIECSGTEARARTVDSSLMWSSR